MMQLRRDQYAPQPGRRRYARTLRSRRPLVVLRGPRGYGKSSAIRQWLAELDALVPDWRARQAWVCGPAGLLDAAESHWDAAGVGQALHVERFRPVVVATGAGGHVSLARQGLELDADGDRPLLDSAEDAGALMPSGCRMGICFGCAVPLTSGAVRDLRTGELTTAEPGDGVVIQTCITAPAGPCLIDA